MIAAMTALSSARALDSTSVIDEFSRDTMAGFSARRKWLPSKYLYDERGSALFEAICETPEYYPTRTETALLQTISPALSAAIPPAAALIEYGSGASLKTRILLAAAPNIGAYVPIDISEGPLQAAAATIRADFPRVAVVPLLADFTAPLALPFLGSRARVGFFPGSTLGNFTPDAAVAFLAGARRQLGPGGSFILGADVIKDEATLVAAYDDAGGITSAFNLNLLTRINRELDGDFDLSAFAHRAIWNGDERRMEMHLVSLGQQTVNVSGWRFAFAKGETIHTENAYKFTPPQLDSLARRAGWTTSACWISDAPAFAITLLKTA